MKWQVLVALLVMAGASSQAGTESEQVAIGQPSIYWHNGEWQTYKDGVWTPYSKSKAQLAKGADSKNKEGKARVTRMRQQRTEDGQNVITGNESTLVLGQPNIGIGQPNAGIGERNGIGQTTIGIGKPTIGIGQTTIGIGQPNMAMGQTTIGIGKPNTGIGQTTIGIGQPNTGIGQPTIGIGQPNTSIGQTTIGIGRPTIGIGKPNATFPPPSAESQRERSRHNSPD